MEALTRGLQSCEIAHECIRHSLTMAPLGVNSPPTQQPQQQLLFVWRAALVTEGSMALAVLFREGEHFTVSTQMAVRICESRRSRVPDTPPRRRAPTFSPPARQEHPTPSTLRNARATREGAATSVASARERVRASRFAPQAIYFARRRAVASHARRVHPSCSDVPVVW